MMGFCDSLAWSFVHRNVTARLPTNVRARTRQCVGAIRIRIEASSMLFVQAAMVSHKKYASDAWVPPPKIHARGQDGPSVYAPHK